MILKSPHHPIESDKNYTFIKYLPNFFDGFERNINQINSIDEILELDWVKECWTSNPDYIKMVKYPENKGSYSHYDKMGYAPSEMIGVLFKREECRCLIMGKLKANIVNKKIMSQEEFYKSIDLPIYDSSAKEFASDI